MQSVEIKDQLEASEKLMREVTKTWEEKLRDTEIIHKVANNEFFHYWIIIKMLLT